MRQHDLGQIIKRLRQQGSDDGGVEVKSCETKLSSDVWESVSAFANTEGGLILLGLEEKNDFKPVRSFAIQRVLDQFVSGMGDGDPSGSRISRPPAYHPHRLTFEGKPVLAIDIDELEANQKPCYITGRGIIGGSYKRIDDKDVRLSPTEIYSLQNLLQPSQADRQPVAGASIDDLSSKIVDDLLAREKGSRALRGARTRREKLTRLSIIDEQGNVTLAGLLTCGNYPQQFFPKLVVDVAVHPGIQKADPTASARFLDREVCEGSIGEVIDEAYRAITRNLRTYSIVRGAGRVDELEIPGEVLREALANAIVHREYGDYFKGQAVSADIYPDRVEITNPGGLWGGKTLENIGDGVSVCRNSTLLKLMSFMPLPSGSGASVEGNGSGVPLMRSAMSSRALEEPRFVSRIDSFKVILGRSGTEIDENKLCLESAFSHALAPHERAIAVVLKREGQVSVSSMRGRLGIDSDEVREIFKDLVDDGVATWVGADEIGFDSRPSPKRREKWTRQEWCRRILAVLDSNTPRGVRDIAQELDRSPDNVRIYLKELVDEGRILATAPSTSRNRKYLLKG